MLKRFLQFLDQNLWTHDWRYHNPFNRTCAICGRHEVEYCSSTQYAAHGLGAPGWWEVYNEGDRTKHYWTYVEPTHRKQTV